MYDFYSQELVGVFSAVTHRRAFFGERVKKFSIAQNTPGCRDSSIYFGP